MARVLNMEEILKLQAESRSRGEYLVRMDEFVKSGDLAWDFSDLFPGKEAEAIRNSVNQNAQKHSHDKGWPVLRVMIDRSHEPSHCVVLNMDKLNSQQSEQNGTDPTTNEVEEND